MPNAQSINHSTAQRIQALTLVEHDVSSKEVAAICEISYSTVYRLKKKTRERDYDSSRVAVGSGLGQLF